MFENIFENFPRCLAKNDGGNGADFGSIAVADDLSKVPEIRAKGASSIFLNSAPAASAKGGLQTSTILGVRFTRLEGDGNRACPNQAIEAVTGFKFDLDVLRKRFEVASALRTIGRAAQD